MNNETKYNKRHGLIRALWCVDSETSREYLIDVDSKQILAERVNGKLIDPSEIKP